MNALSTPDRRYQDWAHEVEQLLIKALARDDERGAHRCPVCGRVLHAKDRS